MPDEHDATAVTEELPPLEAGRVGGGPEVFSGRARVVVLSDLERALIGEADDPSAHREWVWATDRGHAERDGEGPVIEPGGEPSVQGTERRRSLVSNIAHGAVFALLIIPPLLIVAFGIAVAAS